MEKFSLFSAVVFLFVLLAVGGETVDSDPSTDEPACGYVEVRRRAHMFWLYYTSPYRVQYAGKTWPTILWLQGGPGASGVGIGNFQEIGQLNTNLKPRKSTWLQVADLLFVDNPVGTGFSYVEDKDLFVKTDAAAASDLTALLTNLSTSYPSFQQSSLYIVAESYGGKFAVSLALSVLNAINSGNLTMKLGGVALGNSWISPVDYVLVWAPLLKDLSRLDDHGVGIANNLTTEIQRHMERGEYENATLKWDALESQISLYSNHVNFYNLLLDDDANLLESSEGSLALDNLLSKKNARTKYAMYLNSHSYLPGKAFDMDDFMNTVVKKKFKIIPNDVTWGGQAGYVFGAMAADFMQPRICEVDELLNKGVNVTIYTGQVDLICATKGTDMWMKKLKWGGLAHFLATSRTPLLSKDRNGTAGFTKSYKNLHMYWILGSGHFVPVEAPFMGLQMAAAITQSPAQTQFHF